MSSITNGSVQSQPISVDKYIHTKATDDNSIISNMFKEVTIQERVEETKKMLTNFLRVQRLNGIAKNIGVGYEANCSLELKGNGIEHFQLRLQDLVQLGREEKAWKSVFTQEHFIVQTKFDKPWPYFKGDSISFTHKDITLFIETDYMTFWKSPQTSHGYPVSLSFDQLTVTVIHFSFPRIEMCS